MRACLSLLIPIIIFAAAQSHAWDDVTELEPNAVIVRDSPAVPGVPEVSVTPAATAPAQTQPADPADGLCRHGDEPAREICRRTNSWRYTNRRALVRSDATLTRLAQQHAAWMDRHNVMDHGDFAGRMRRAGIGDAAENIADAPDPATVVSLWKNSSGHNFNMLKAGARRIGVGHSGRYWCEILAD